MLSTQNIAWGLPTFTALGECRMGSSIGPTCSSIMRVSRNSSARGIDCQSKLGGPISTVTDISGFTVPPNMPAFVSIVTCGRPVSGTISTDTHLVAFPQASTSPPSALMTRIKTSALSDGPKRMIWSQPIPVFRFAISWATDFVRLILCLRVSIITKSLPRPFILRNGILDICAVTVMIGKWSCV